MKKLTDMLMIALVLATFGCTQGITQNDTFLGKTAKITICENVPAAQKSIISVTENPIVSATITLTGDNKTQTATWNRGENFYFEFTVTAMTSHQLIVSETDSTGKTVVNSAVITPKAGVNTVIRITLGGTITITVDSSSSSSSSSVPDTLQDGLVAYFPLDSDTVDHSGNGYPGVNYGAVSTDNGWMENGKAYLFASNAYIVSSADDALGTSPGAVKTYSLWFKALGTNPENSMALVGKFRGFSYNNENFIIKLNYYPENNTYRIMAGGVYGNEYSAVILPDTLYHLAAQFDSARSEIKIYLNGKLAGTFSVGLNTYHCTEPLVIGACFNQITDRYFFYFNGMIDNVRIYDRALTGLEIQSLFDNHL